MKEHKRALAHIEKIAWTKPIEGADNIELVGILGWQCIAKKGEFQVGDPCVYFEIDSKVPEEPVFEFLRPRNFCIKTMKLSKFKDEYGNEIISQGLAVPLSKLDSLKKYSGEGIDVTEILGVVYSNPDDNIRKGDADAPAVASMTARHERIFKNPFVKQLMRYKLFRKIMLAIFGKKKDKPLQFPSWIKKTDEERIENKPQYLDDTKTVWIMSEKIDGTSTTFAMRKRWWMINFCKPYEKNKWKLEFYVCSRHVRQRTVNQNCQHESNVYWEIAQKYDIEHVLYDILGKSKASKVILQGETYGFKLQGNPYEMDHIDFKAFNLKLIYRSNIKYLNLYEMERELAKYNVPCVPNLGEYQMPNNINMHDFKAVADGKSVVNPNVMREGLVFRDKTNSFRSFKNVSNIYLFKHDL